MTAPLGRAAPLRFHIGVLLCWTMGRVVMLNDWTGGATAPARAAGRIDPPRAHRPPPVRLRPPPSSLPEMFAARTMAVTWWRSGPPLFPAGAPSPARPVDPVLPHRDEPGSVDAPALTLRRPLAPHRWSGSAWAFVRGGGRTDTLAPVGQIGGGQAGARLLYRLDGQGRLAVAARLSRTIGGPRQSEAAIGLDWRPVARLPLHVMADRRIAIDRGGRDAWTLGVAGGVYALALAAHWRLDGYGEAGAVGTRRRDLYADGAVRIARSIDLGGGASLAPGGGVWGAAQPGARRLDLGPSAVLRLPVDRRAVSIALDWRERVAGSARPGSGIALTVAMDL